MLNVLFLCTANSARSQIAEALLRDKGGEGFRVGSAGITPADRVDPRVVTLLGQMGIDWSNRAPKGLEAVRLDSIGLRGVEETLRRVGTESPDSQSSSPSN